MARSFDVPQFTTAQAASAAGIPLAALKMQWQRGDIALAPSEAIDTRHPGSGRTRRMTGLRVLHVVLTQQLARLGIPLKTASTLALAFTDHTAADSWPAAHLLGDQPATGRRPGELYPTDATVFRVLFNTQGEPIASVDRADDIGASPFTLGSVRHQAVVMIDMNDLVARTDAALREISQ